VCRRYAELQGFTVVAEYEDAAISGASTLRPGYQKLLEDARKRTFDIVLAESLDRLSRGSGGCRDAPQAPLLPGHPPVHGNGG
jgi:DNA invertase Pin-like site-specific DNA recombinase